jgi:hypothetical protein
MKVSTIGGGRSGRGRSERRTLSVPLQSWAAPLVACVACCLVAGAAEADPIYPLDGGFKYQISFQAEKPVTGNLIVDVLAEYAADSALDGHLIYYGGGNYETYFTFPTATESGSVFFKVPRPYSLYLCCTFGPVIENHPFLARAYFVKDGGFGDVDVTVTAEAVGTVPEPETWAVMVLGFGGVGAAVRRRRQAHQPPPLLGAEQ